MTKLAGRKTEEMKRGTFENKKTAEASLTRRLIAYLIDWYIGGLATAFPISVISMKLFDTVQNQNIMSFPAPYHLIAGSLGVLGGILYYLSLIHI